MKATAVRNHTERHMAVQAATDKHAVYPVPFNEVGDRFTHTLQPIRGLRKDYLTKGVQPGQEFQGIPLACIPALSVG